MRRAVIDIGTNTVKLLVADVDGGTVTPVHHLDDTTRLGEGIVALRKHSERSLPSSPTAATGTVAPRLSPAAMARTVVAIDRYAAEARRRGAGDVIALTTSATRNAGNAAEFLDAVRRQTGLAVQVISGEREAALIFRGAASDPAWAGQRLLAAARSGFWGRGVGSSAPKVCRSGRCGCGNSSATTLPGWRPICAMRWPVSSRRTGQDDGG